MRKLILGCTVGAVMLFAGAVTLAHIAVRHPGTVVGRTLHGMTHAANVLNPFGGFGPVLIRMKAAAHPHAAAPIDGIPDEPTAVPEGSEAHGENILVPVATADPIVIPETAMPPLLPVLDNTVSPVQYVGPITPGHDCPPGPLAQAAPTVMPYCEEECEPPLALLPCPRRCAEPAKAVVTEEPCEVLPMPRACGIISRCSEEESEEPGCGRLKMPTPCMEEEQEETAETCPTGGSEKLLRMFEQILKKNTNGTESAEPESGTIDNSRAKGQPTATPECREDPDYIRQHSGTPNTGVTTPVCPRAKPILPHEMSKRKTAPIVEMGEEACEDTCKSALQLIRGFQSRVDINESSPKHPEVDTMEYRADDRSLGDFGPSPL